MVKINTWIGIDQTGSKKPLPLALLTKTSNGHFKLELFKLTAFTQEDIEKLNIPIQSNQTWITADCVLWPLIKPSVQGMWLTFAEAQLHRNAGNELGRKSSENFFESLKLKKHLDHTSIYRPVELKAGSNSVFTIYPYQRNIQTGTYRIWSEIGSRPWLNIWPFNKKGIKSRAWLAEGYPTWFWKKIFETKTRSPELLHELIKSKFKEKIEYDQNTKDTITRSPDFADAVVLAIGTCILMQNQPSLITEKRGKHPNHGWILGVD